MSMTPIAIHRRFGWRLLPIATSLALSLILAPAPGLWGQSDAAPSPGQPAVQFEVLDVSTGTGSKTQTPGGNGASADSGSGASMPGQPQGVIPAVPMALPGVTPTPPRPLTPEEKELIEKHSGLMAALESWHRQVLSNYRIDVTMLADPFMPIKEVRGTPTNGGMPAVDLSLPPLLRYDLNQLKLVAITVLSDRPGGSLASFEDGAGSSYILRVGDRIGRNNGKVIKINPSAVTVEETGRYGQDKPRITDIRLNVLSREGLTRATE